MGWLWAIIVGFVLGLLAKAIIIVGFVLGLLAKAIIPGKQHSPLWLTTIFGILGAIVGNAVARAAGVDSTSGIDWMRHLFQLVAAIVIVFLGDMAYMATLGRKRERT